MRYTKPRIAATDGVKLADRTVNIEYSWRNVKPTKCMYYQVLDPDTFAGPQYAHELNGNLC